MVSRVLAHNGSEEGHLRAEAIDDLGVDAQPSNQATGALQHPS
jgi:hypothetical protein